MEPIVPQERGQREMVNLRDKMHPETRAILAELPIFKDSLEHGGISASELARVHKWSYDRLLHWLGKMDVLDFSTGRNYGESKKMFELRKQHEKISVETCADEAIKSTIRRLESTIERLGEELRKSRREASDLGQANDNLRHRIERYGIGI